MKLLPFFITLMILGTASLAQDIKTSMDFKVETSEPYKVIDAKTKIYLSNSNHIVAVKITKKKEVHIQSFNNKDLSLIKTTYHKEFDKKVVFDSFYTVGEKFYVFYSLWDKKNRIEQLFVREIDPKTADFTGKEKKIIEVNGKISGDLSHRGGYSYEVVNKFEFQTSRNEDILLIKYRKDPEVVNDSKSYDEIGVYIFDADINEIWSKTKKMPYTEKKMDFFDSAVDQEGNAYILTKVFNDDSTDDKKSKKDKELNYHVELFKVTPDSKDAMKIDLTLDDNKFLKNIVLYEGNDGKMLIGGYYSSIETKESIEGVFFFKPNNVGKYQKYYHDIPLEILAQNESKKTAKKQTKKDEKGKAGFPELELDQIVTSDDGSVTLIGEQAYVTSHTSYSQDGGSRTTYTYHYDDILVTKFTPEGTVAWMHKIPKKQTGKAGQGGMSYEYMSGNDNHYLLYLDNVKNINLPDNKPPYQHSDGAGGYFTSAKIHDPSGKKSKESLFNLRNVNGKTVYQFNTERIIQLSEDEIAIEVYKKQKEDILIRVKLN